MNNLCNNYETCKLFLSYGSDKSRGLALKGFKSLYCEGNKQNQCVRKVMGDKLGGMQYTPQNMMCNGLPLTGTRVVDWNEKVFEILSDLNVRVFRGDLFSKNKFVEQ